MCLLCAPREPPAAPGQIACVGRTDCSRDVFPPSPGGCSHGHHAYSARVSIAADAGSWGSELRRSWRSYSPRSHSFPAARISSNKIGLDQDAYFTVQNIYRGWALFGIVLFGALAANLALAITVRRQRAPFGLAFVAFLLVAATLVIFFTWTYPANQATSNWTVVPANWQELRTQWEYAHATNAVLTFLALCAVTWSVLLTRD